MSKSHMCLAAFTALGLVGFLIYEGSRSNVFETRPSDWELVGEGRNSSDQSVGGPDVLVVGVSKTGTSSMKAALELLGYECVHWQEWITNYFEFLSYSYDGLIQQPDMHKVFAKLPPKTALLDCPTPALYDELRAAFPRAKVLLTTRESKAWLKSYKNYVNMAWLYHPEKFPCLLSLSYFSRALGLGSVMRQLGFMSPAASGFDFENLPELARFYQRSDEVMYGSYMPNHHWPKKRQQFEDRVRAEVPSEQLLVFDAFIGDSFEKLREFIGVPREGRNFPTEFPREYTKEDLATKGGHNVFLRENQVYISFVVTVLLTLLCLPLGVVLLLHRYLNFGTTSKPREDTDLAKVSEPNYASAANVNCSTALEESSKTGQSSPALTRLPSDSSVRSRLSTWDLSADASDTDSTTSASSCS